MKHLHTRLAAAGATALTVLVTGALVAPSAHAADPRPPILTKWANPGVAKDGSVYVMTHTTGWNARGAFATASKPNGPWKRTSTTLLTKTPAWAKPAKGKPRRGVWAPSIIKGRDGRWVVFYSALVPGTKHARCIGTGTASRAIGPYVPDPRPIACFKGSGTKAQDVIRNEGRTSLIDATPSVVNGQTVLTYKTSHSYRGKAGQARTMWHTTIRMLALNPTTPNRIAPNPVHANGRSIQLTSKRHKYIEENPSLIYRAGTYTLFTSWGWYGTHDRYWTQYRQAKNPWRSWNAIKPTRLSFPKGTNTRGWGNAQAAPGVSGWVLFWNGQEPARQFTRGEGPKWLYVGQLGWKQGRPFVKKVLNKA